MHAKGLHVSSSVSCNFRSLLFLKDAKKVGPCRLFKNNKSEDTIFFDAILRDFKADHPDFESPSRKKPTDSGNNAKRKVGFVKGVWKSKCMTYSRYVALEPNLNNSQNNINSKGCWNGWSPLKCQIQVSFVNVHEVFPCVFWKDLWQYLCTYPIIRWFFCYSTDLFPALILWNEVTRPWWG